MTAMQMDEIVRLSWRATEGLLGSPVKAEQFVVSLVPHVPGLIEQFGEAITGAMLTAEITTKVIAMGYRPDIAIDAGRAAAICVITEHNERNH